MAGYKKEVLEEENMKIKAQIPLPSDEFEKILRRFGLDSFDGKCHLVIEERDIVHTSGGRISPLVKLHDKIQSFYLIVETAEDATP